MCIVRATTVYTSRCLSVKKMDWRIKSHRRLLRNQIRYNCNKSTMFTQLYGLYYTCVWFENPSFACILKIYFMQCPVWKMHKYMVRPNGKQNRTVKAVSGITQNVLICACGNRPTFLSLGSSLWRHSQTHCVSYIGMVTAWGGVPCQKFIFALLIKKLPTFCVFVTGPYSDDISQSFTHFLNINLA
jgi:hypothetical protein